MTKNLRKNVRRLSDDTYMFTEVFVDVVLALELAGQVIDIELVE